MVDGIKKMEKENTREKFKVDTEIKIKTKELEKAI